MKDQINTIREALVLGIKAINHLGGAREAMPLHDAMPALTQLEAMVGEHEPCGWYDDGRVFLHEGKLPPNGADLYAAPVAPVAQPQQAEAVPPCSLIDPGTVVSFAVDRWFAEVANRPLVNKNRRTLDGTWRQVIRRFGGDPGELLGPSHDELVAIAQQKGGV